MATKTTSVKWERRGKDGISYQYFHKLTASESAPGTPVSSPNDNYIPTGWSKVRPAVTRSLPYCWMIERRKEDTWSDFSAPLLVDRFIDNYMIPVWWNNTLSYKITEAGIPVVKVPDSTTLGYSAFSLIVYSSTAGQSPVGSSEWRLMESTEYMLMQQAYIERLQAALVTAEKIESLELTVNNLTAIGGTFKDVVVTGSTRSPFTLESGTFSKQTVDHIMVESPTSGIKDFYIYSDLTRHSGRRLLIIDTRTAKGAATNTGRVRLSITPNLSGQYFYENGVASKEIYISKELIELVGIGTADKFEGWAVINRVHYNGYRTSYEANGRLLPVLSYGTVEYNNGSFVLKDFGSSVGPASLSYSNNFLEMKFTQLTNSDIDMYNSVVLLGNSYLNDVRDGSRSKDSVSFYIESLDALWFNFMIISGNSWAEGKL